MIRLLFAHHRPTPDDLSTGDGGEGKEAVAETRVEIVNMF